MAPPGGRFRWLICLLLFLITVNNYMDRQMFSIAAPVMAAEFHLTNSDIALIANAFLLAYTVGQLFAGILVDRTGARAGLTLAVAWWSVSAMLTSVARGAASLCSFRFLLGASESMNYPAGVKVAAEWFPPKELATAVGILQSGSSVGAMIAPPAAAWLIVQFGWKAAFVIVAVPGLLWIPFWRMLYRRPEESPRLTAGERKYILEERRSTGAGSARGWRPLLRQRLVWGVFFARFFEEPAGWFYFTWLPLYLKNQRAVSLLHAGFLLVIPFVTYDIGKIGGGWASSRLMRRGWPLDRARKAVLFVSAAALTASIPAIFAGTALAFVLLISIATFGHGCWATTVQTIPGDLVPAARVGAVYGITAFGGGVGSMVFMQASGKMADAFHSFQLPFVIAGVLPVIALALFLVLVPRIRPIE